MPLKSPRHRRFTRGSHIADKMAATSAAVHPCAAAAKTLVMKLSCLGGTTERNVFSWAVSNRAANGDSRHSQLSTAHPNIASDVDGPSELKTAPGHWHGQA